MTHRAFRSYRVANPLLKARELQTSIRPVGGDEAADWAGPDGNQAIAMRSSVLDDIPKSRLWRNPICPTGSRFSTSCWPQGANQWSAFADESMPVTWADGHERACRTKDVRVSLMTPGINVGSENANVLVRSLQPMRPIQAACRRFFYNTKTKRAGTRLG